MALPELLDDVELPLDESPDDDSSTTLLEGGSIPEPLDESPLDESPLLLESPEPEDVSLLLGSITLELGSTTLDDGSLLDEGPDPDELDDHELLELHDELLLDPLDELEHGAQQQQPA